MVNKKEVAKIIERAKMQFCQTSRFDEVRNRTVKLPKELSLWQIQKILREVNARFYFGPSIILELGKAKMVDGKGFKDPVLRVDY